MAATSTRKTSIAHFKITGSGFTGIVRDLMLSEEPAKAWRLVTEGLHGSQGGISVERYAAMILDGTHRLIGNESNMQITRDPSKAAKKYREELKYIYAGRVRIDKQWWRPKAQVVEFGTEDAHYASELNNGEVPSTLIHARGESRRWWRNRVGFYARNGECVVEVRRAGRTGSITDALLIFEPCSEPPFWWTPNATPTKAVEEMDAADRRIEEIKYSDYYRPQRNDPAPSLIETEVHAEISARQAASRAAEKAEREAEEDAETARLIAEEEAERERIKAAVIERAAGDMIDLHADDGKVVATVPRAPFENWALRRTALRHLAAPWEPVARSGLKMANDDPNHTDWVLGGGLDIKNMYFREDPIQAAAYHEMSLLQERLGDFECGVIVDAGEVEGKAGADIVILPDLQPDHLDKIKNVRAIITQTGGKVAHLAQVAMERNITIMLVPDALTRFTEGMSLTLTPAEGRIHIHIVSY
jgi:phosphohistidine swiveling domain-containing protein